MPLPPLRPAPSNPAPRSRRPTGRPPEQLNKLLAHPATRVLLWVLMLIPLGLLILGGVQDTLGANPAEALIRGLGDWTLRLLCLTLAISPVRQLTGWHGLLRWRRHLGLGVFLYATLHWLAYAGLDQGFDLNALWHDVQKRPFVLVGTAAWLGLVPLAATSFNAAIRAMGGRRWQDLHKAIYGITLAALLHFFWIKSGKNDLNEVGVYGVIIGLLLYWRWARWRRGL